jgi:hypothetical protein
MNKDAARAVRLLRRLLPWLALVVYLATVGLGGLALHRERTARRWAVNRLTADFQYLDVRRKLDELDPVPDAATVTSLRPRRPALEVVRGDEG